MRTSDWYEGFATREAADNSPAYERLARAVAADPLVLARLDELPEDKRQPNLLFGAVRWLGGPVEDPAASCAWMVAHWDDVAATMRARMTQTNEPRRMATLLPVLASLDGPLALLEVGASAGLCLYPDRWRYEYDGATRGAVGSADDPVLTCELTGAAAVPQRLPEVAWRGGIDLNPLDVCDPDDVRWLESLVWPEQQDRLERLRTAVRVAQEEPAELVAGDLNEGLAALAATVPDDATLVVFHSAVLAYVPPADRDRFVAQVTALPGHWVSNEGPGVLPELVATVPAGHEDPQRRFLTALDGRAVAWAGPHGQSVELFEG